MLFHREVSNNYDQPSEDGIVQISRAAGVASYPAQFILIAAANPCPCGYLGDEKRQCRCSPGQIIRYQKRLSGPILDRIDLHLEIPAVKVEKLTGETSVAEDSKSIRRRVQKARDKQNRRFQGKKIMNNAEMQTKEIKEFCPLSADCLNLLRQAVSQMNLSARGYYRVIKVARTIADLTGEEKINVTHIAEALQYRPRLQEF